MLFFERNERNNILKHNAKTVHRMVFFDHLTLFLLHLFKPNSNLVIFQINPKWINHVN